MLRYLFLLAIAGETVSLGSSTGADADTGIHAVEQMPGSAMRSPFVVSGSALMVVGLGLPVLPHLCGARGVEGNSAEATALSALSVARAVAVPRPIGVRVREFVAVGAVGPLGVTGSGADSSENILARSNRLDVVRIEAPSRIQ